MESLLWAIGSMLLVMIIIQFLPIGFTIRGKFVVVLAAFFIALIGLIATLFFTLWQVTIMLFVLISFTAYLLNNRLRYRLFVNNDSSGIFSADKEEPYLDNIKMNKTESDDRFSLNRNESAAAIEDVEEMEAFDRSLFYTQHEIEQKVEELQDGIDEDVSFLLNRSIEIEEEKSNEETFIETEYISDIESLLLEASEEGMNDESEDLSLKSEDMDVLPILSFDSFPLSQKEQTETDNPLAELDEIPLLTFHDHKRENHR